MKTSIICPKAILLTKAHRALFIIMGNKHVKGSEYCVQVHCIVYYYTIIICVPLSYRIVHICTVI